MAGLSLKTRTKRLDGTVLFVEIVGFDALVASRVGVFCEPASAASVAGLRKRAREDRLPVPRRGTIVCTLTGHGLKDPERAVAGVAVPTPISGELSALRDTMDGLAAR